MMKPNNRTRLATLIATLCVAPASAMANTNFFTPVSGYDLISVNHSPTIQHYFGYVENIDQTASQYVIGSLGHAQGGSNGFTFHGTVPNTTIYCYVLVSSSATGTGVIYSGQTTVNGVFSLHINTTPSSGDYFYSGTCLLPPYAQLSGIDPDH